MNRGQGGMGAGAPRPSPPIIERCSPGPYLELFARRKRPEWDAWGDQITCDVAL